MSLGHSEASFNHSCLKVPVNSLSRKPSPKYERQCSAKPQQKQAQKDYPLSNLYNNFTSVKSYLEFYESIPDYTELHHLSNEEFYKKLKSLKQTQKRFCSESGVACTVEEDYPDGKYSGSSLCSQKLDEKKNNDVCVCCSECTPSKEYCYFYDSKTKKVGDVLAKQPPPKINIISDNENSDPFGFKTGYEADRESSNLQPVEKSLNVQKKNLGDECCSRRSRSLPVSPECDCDSPEICHRFSEISFRNDYHRGCGSSYYLSEKDKQSFTKKPKKGLARPVPLTSRIPLFDKIMMEKEARRRIMHDQYSEELRSLVKPFSFTKREEQKERLRMISSNPELTSTKPPMVRFKAKPIPKHLFSNYAYEKMKEDEFYRALKRRVRAEELLKMSSLPPSMALRERMKSRSKSLDFLDYRCCKKTWNKANGYRRACEDIKKDIEFDQKAPKRKLRSSWISNRRINSATDSSTEISPYECVIEPSTRRKSRPHSAFSGRNNLASVLRIQTARRRLEKEMEEKLRESRLKNEAKFKARLMRLTPAWRELNIDKDEDLALRMAARREEEREKRINHQKLMESIYGRVYRMPPLFQREKFPNGRKLRKTSFNEKDSVTYTYNDSPENHRTEAEEEEEKNLKSYDYSTAEQKENGRSVKSSESFASCEKSEKDKIYESDDIWQND